MKRTVVVLSLAITTGCAGSFRTIGMQDPGIEITRALAKVLSDAFASADKAACPVPVPSQEVK